MSTTVLSFNRFARLALFTLATVGVLAGKSLSFAAQNDDLNVDEDNQFTSPILLGVYSKKFLGNQKTIDRELRQLDQWAGKRLSIAGSFIDIEAPNPAYDIPVSLELIYQNGYTGFINLTSTRTAAEIANGEADEGLKRLARAYVNWSAQGEGRMAFIAPLPEMNGFWEAYKEDPTNFKLAYRRIQTIFAKAGVSPDAVRWVFAPNGWSREEHLFEYYYPGDRYVDVLAFSAYNWGHCQAAAWKNWDQPQEIYEPYIKRLQVMAPSKPIFIAQTATTSHTANGSQRATKNQWLEDAYTYLATAPGIRGILYFNLRKECDWELFNAQSDTFDGYKKAITNPAFGYVSPEQLAQLELERKF